MSTQSLILLASILPATLLISSRVVASNKAATAATISNELGWKIFSCAAGSSDQHNVFYSPVSISTLLALLCYGAAGDTLREINNLLLPAAAYTSKHRCELGPYFMSLQTALGTYNTSNITIEIANSAWHRQELHAMFRLRGRNYFNLEEFLIDLGQPTEVANQINSWVEEKSRGKLTDFFDPRDIKPTDQVYLFNMLYFVGVWSKKFSTNVYMKKFTTCASCINGSDVVTESGVEYIKLVTNEVPYVNLIKEHQLQAVRLPYANGNVTMTVVLPELCAMNQVANQLAHSDLFQHIDRQLRPTPDLIIVLPKFQMSEDLPIKSVLSNLGLQSVFTSPKGFPKLLKHSESLFLSKMTHKAVIKVDEEGTEAAAVTGGHVGITSLNLFYATRPFIVLISEHTTGALLFMGRVCSVQEGGKPIVITSGPHCSHDNSPMSGSGSGQ